MSSFCQGSAIEHDNVVKQVAHHRCEQLLAKLSVFYRLRRQLI